MLYLIREDMFRGGSRVAATSKMECFVVIVNGFQPLTIITKHSICFQPLTIITKHSILDVAAALDPSLILLCYLHLSFLIITITYRNLITCSKVDVLIFNCEPHLFFYYACICYIVNEFIKFMKC